MKHIRLFILASMFTLSSLTSSFLLADADANQVNDNENTNSATGSIQGVNTGGGDATSNEDSQESTESSIEPNATEPNTTELNTTEPNATEQNMPNRNNQSQTARYLMYSGMLRLQVFRITDNMERLESMVENVNGYIHSFQGSQMEIRIPTEVIQSFFTRMRTLGQVTQEEIRSQDRTQEYYNTQSRLQSSLETLERYSGLLNEAVKVEEALQVEREMVSLTQRIESYKGTLRYLRHNSQYGSFTITFEEKQQINLDQANPFGWMEYVGIHSLLNAR